MSDSSSASSRQGVTRERVGCYVLPGAATDPRRGLDEARAAERLGLGTAWLGERYDTKDLPSLAGAIGQVTDRIRIGAAVTHPVLRHPMVLASMGQTLQALTGGRFVMGFGRSADWRWAAYGAQAPTLRALEDIASILRRLWAGDTVSHEGPLGSFPRLRLAQHLELPPPPLLLAAIGPKTLDLAGRAYDGVILHPLLTPEGVRRSILRVRDAAAAAGRDPDAIRCAATLVVAPDLAPEAARAAVDARAAGYLSVAGLGDAIVGANGWARDALAAFRDQPALRDLAGLPADKNLSRDQLAELAEALPHHWLPDATAVGSADACVARIGDYLLAGADEIILHGARVTELDALVGAIPARPA